jgi:uncharacterized membrane protein YbhN (UPF0104 family)
MERDVSRRETDVNDEAAPAPAPAPKKRRWVRTLVTWTVALAALAFVIRMVPFRDKCTEAGCTDGLFTTFARAKLPVVLGLFVLYLFSTFIWAVRWRALLGLARVKVPALELWKITLQAQAGGILLPGGVAGDALRIAYVREHAPDAPLAKLMASILADRVVGLVTLALLATLAGVTAGAAELGRALWFIAAIPVGAAVGLAVVRHPAIARWSFLHRGFVGKLASPMIEYANEPGGPAALGRGFVASLLVSATTLVCVRGLAYALGSTPTNEAWVYAGGTLAAMVAAVPATPGAWGTADAAYVFFLGHAGIPAPVAAALCLLLRVFWYATGVIGAILALSRRTR